MNASSPENQVRQALGGDIVVASTPASAGLRRLHENDRTELVVASEEIRQHSQDLDADLIALGTNRKYSAAHRTVVRESNCPVLFARSK